MYTLHRKSFNRNNNQLHKITQQKARTFMTCLHDFQKATISTPGANVGHAPMLRFHWPGKSSSASVWINGFPIDDMADSPWALAHHALVQCLVLLLAQCLRLNAAFCWIFFHWGFSFAFARLLKIHRNVKKWKCISRNEMKWNEMKWNVFHISSYLFSMGAWKETQSRLRHCLIDACKFSTFTVQCCMSTESTLHSLTD